MSQDSQVEANDMRRMVEVDETVEGPDMTEEEGVLDLDQAREVIPYTYEMTAYGADYPVDALVSRLGTGDISIPMFGHPLSDSPGQTGFQREFVWTKPQADKFIESLLLGLPVPGIFLVERAKRSASRSRWTPAVENPSVFLRWCVFREGIQAE